MSRRVDINHRSDTCVTQYEYDSLDRVVEMTYPDGEVVSTNYDDQGLPKRLHSDTYSEDYASDVSYNALGQMTALPLGNEVTTGYTYDALNARLTRIQRAGS